MTIQSERFELRLGTDVLTRIDNWRRDEFDTPNRSEAVRRLVAIALQQAEETKSFELARFNVLCAALQPGTREKLSDAYVFAWERYVYPGLDHGSTLHEPYSHCFQVSGRMLDELVSVIADREESKKPITFYELEDHFMVRDGHSPWNRSKLISACRYLFLHESWDRTVWDALLKKMEHPMEAASICRQYIRDDALFLT